jgi:hypothetical protein
MRKCAGSPDDSTFGFAGDGIRGFWKNPQEKRLLQQNVIGQFAAPFGAFSVRHRTVTL